jgi:cytochrome c553
VKDSNLILSVTMISRFSRAIFAALVVVGAPAVSGAADEPPTWAYGTEPQPAAKPQASATPQALGRTPDPTPRHLPGTDLTFTLAQIQDRFGPADWRPNEHPKMPDVVAHGRKPEIWACGLCHYPNGKGRPENAGVAGLPVEYFIGQMHDFREGLRTSADKRKFNTGIMISIAKAMTEEEIKETAIYFGSMKWTPWIKVVETDTVPKTRTSVGMYLPIEGAGAGQEPIGDRIIETPVNAEATETLRDPDSGFIAYAPKGSSAKGERLAVDGGGKTSPCGVCHGSDLKGLGPVPGIAGRSPSYLVRQMYDMQQGTRNGSWTQLMKPVVSKLSQEDMLNIAAYVSSQTP